MFKNESIQEQKDEIYKIIDPTLTQIIVRNIYRNNL